MFSAVVIREGNVPGSILSWFSGEDQGGIGSGEVKGWGREGDDKWLAAKGKGEGDGGDLCLFGVADINGFTSEDVLVALKVPSCPTMLVGPSGVDDRGEKGNTAVFID